MVDRHGWWKALHDPVVDRLVEAALRDNPTLEEAAARVDQARAVLAARGAQRLPNIGVVGNAGTSRDSMGAGAAAVRQSSASLGASLSWEIDLWGRARESRLAAGGRLAARTADAESARLSVVGDIADTVLALRACDMTLAIRDHDIASRETELRISRARLSFGNIAPVTVAASESNLAATRTDRILQAETCQRLLDSLVALSGLGADSIRQLMPQNAGARGDDFALDPPLPAPPPFMPALPATILLANPGVVAAEREVAARWSEIAVARAERLPRLDLAAALTGQWIRALDSSSTHSSNSAGLGLTGPLFDGGAGAANVRGAEAAYREAAAQLKLAVRTAVRDIEDGLAGQQSALARIETARAALTAARFTLRANEARWHAGSIAQYELEETRRQYRGAQESAVNAAADRARAWVALVRRTGTAKEVSAAGQDISGAISGE
jgi:NodT family efflux transporter outer membrane factor (OMF) lipoprotein